MTTVGGVNSVGGIKQINQGDGSVTKNAETTGQVASIFDEATTTGTSDTAASAGGDCGGECGANLSTEA